MVCRVCSTPHHTECWRANGNRCTTIRCAGAGELPELTLSADKSAKVVKSAGTIEQATPKPQSQATVLGCFAFLLVMAGMAWWLTRPGNNTAFIIPSTSIRAANTPTLYVAPSATKIMIRPTATGDSTLQGIVNASPLILRDGPGTNYDLLDRLSQGTIVAILARDSSGEWFKVLVSTTSKQGWVAAKYIETAVPPNSIRISDSIPPTKTPLTISVPTQAPRILNTATLPPPSGVIINYYAEQDLISRGGCTVLHWGIENVSAIYLDGQGVQGWDQRQVCPSGTTTYTLRIIMNNGGSLERGVVVRVQ